MENEGQYVTNKLIMNNRSKTINPGLKYSYGQSKKNNNLKDKKEEKKDKNKEKNINENIKEINKNIKEKKEEKKKIEDSNIKINNITNNNNSHNIYVINNYFEDKNNTKNSINNIKVGLWKDGKRYDRNGIEIEKGGKQN